MLSPEASAVLSSCAFMMSGRVKSVMILLKAVSDTESATSPFANIEKTLLELPPGQQAIRTKPTAMTGGRENTFVSNTATKGNSTN